ncbi:ENHANCER OF AG-4 protein 2 isoform X2 [Tetranychus urticae]|uniref:ENHANCER OF AG-4 protein 2 isoform X2 n=1 Tax=Tetranychus urticae TaxID=32264 RepID=UPI00077B99D4|nr:ENHANCER OF AG-4 protein 2 isoform X2 [Tetranychus urticae]
MNLNEASLEKKLNSCVNTQDSIQSLSLWILHHKSYHKRIVQLWVKALEKGKISHRLTLFYLANDVVQHAKKKNIPGYLQDFEDVLREAILLVKDEKIRPNINRVLNIWQERNIYPLEFVDELRALLVGSSIAKAASASKIVAEFKLSQLIDKIKRSKKIEAVTKQKIEAVNSSRIDALSKEVLNNLKDKSHGEQYSKDFDDATKLMETLVTTLEKEIAIRNDLIEYLEKSEVFYETQKGEAKIVANAYKNFAQRVKSVAKKLTESKTSLPSPIPSPSTDAPSPTNSDDGPQLPGAEGTNGQPSSLDKRLSNLMQGMPLVPNSSVAPPVEPVYAHPAPAALPPALQAAIGINPALASTLDWMVGIQQPPPPPPPPPPPIPTVGAAILPQEIYQTYEYDYYNQINQVALASMVSGDLYKAENETVQPIQAVISSRTDSEIPTESYKPTLPIAPIQYDGYLASQQSHENFEPSDMELGNSDDEEPVSRVQSQRFLKIIETQNSGGFEEEQLNSGSSMSQLVGSESLNQVSNNSPHKQFDPRNQSNNRSRLTPSRHHHHSSRDNRNMEPRWMSPGRPNSQYSGHPPNSYHTAPNRHWKTPSHGSRGSFNRRF